jgi:hypothetical protein
MASKLSEMAVLREFGFKPSGLELDYDVIIDP